MSRVLGVLLAVFTIPFTLGCVGFAVAWLDSGSVTADRTSTAPVGPAPRVAITLGTGSLTVEPGPAGKVVLQEHDSARGLFRFGVSQALAELRTSIRGGHGLAVSIDAPDEPGTWQNLMLGGPVANHRDLTLQVPSGTSLTVAGGTIVRLERLDGPIQVTSTIGVVRLDHLTVTGKSYIGVTRGGIAGSVTMAGGTLDASVVTGGMQLQVTAPGHTRLHALTANGSINFPSDYLLQRSRFDSGYSVDGVIAGSGLGGQLNLNVDAGTITLS